MRSCGGCFGGVIVENGEVLMAAHITSNKAVKLVFARALLLADGTSPPNLRLSRRGVANMARAQSG